MLQIAFVTLRRLAQKLGPYLLLEILLPGGTLFALLLFVYRRRGANASRVPERLTIAVLGFAQRMPSPALACPPGFTIMRSES